MLILLTGNHLVRHIPQCQVRVTGVRWVNCSLGRLILKDIWNGIFLIFLFEKK